VFSQRLIAGFIQASRPKLCLWRAWKYLDTGVEARIHLKPAATGSKQTAKTMQNPLPKEFLAWTVRK